MPEPVDLRAIAELLRELADLAVDEWLGIGGRRLGDGNERWVAYDRAQALAEALEAQDAS